MTILRWIAIIALFYLIYQVLKGLVRVKDDPVAADSSGGPQVREAGPPEDLVRDPHCGVYFPRSEGVASLVDGQVYYFLNEECRDAYMKERQAESRGGHE